MGSSKMLRVPREFDAMLGSYAEQIQKETGYKKNKTAAMRKLVEIKDKLVFKGNKFDWRFM